MAKKKAAASNPTPQPQADQKAGAPHERMALYLDKSQTERLETLAQDYGLKIRAARTKAEELLPALLDSLEDIFEEERKQEKQLKIGDLERELAEARAELEAMSDLPAQEAE